MLKKLLPITLISLLLLIIPGIILFYYPKEKTIEATTPITDEPLEQNDNNPFANIYDRFPELRNWQRPPGPPKVALQVGHWKNEEFPEELARLKGNTGAQGGGKWEWEVNYQIASATAELLKKEGVQVEILPATVPPSYWADVFVAIHADSHTDTTKTGFKASGPRRDYTGRSNELVRIIEEEYAKSTGLTIDPYVTRNMTGYYAFSWWRFEHAIHPKTVGVILETGFLTNPEDRKIIVKNYQKSTEGLAAAIKRFLNSELSYNQTPSQKL